MIHRVGGWEEESEVGGWEVGWDGMGGRRDESQPTSSGTQGSVPVFEFPSRLRVPFPSSSSLLPSAIPTG